MDARTDDELLAATKTQPDAFAVFYRRHVAGVIAYFARRTRCPVASRGAASRPGNAGARDSGPGSARADNTRHCGETRAGAV